MTHADILTTIVPDGIKDAYQYRYCKRNPEKRQKTQKDYYQRNQEKLRAYRRAQYYKKKAAAAAAAAATAVVVDGEE